MTDMLKLALYATAVDRLRRLRHASMGRLDCIGHMEDTPGNQSARAYLRGRIDGLESALMALGSMNECPQCGEVYYDNACPCVARERM